MNATPWEDVPATPDPEAPDADQHRPPDTVADLWQQGLLDEVLDPDKKLVQLEGAGMGIWLDQVLGGGLQAGNMVGFGAAGAGAGKTAFIHQVADGVAKAGAEALESAAGAAFGKPEVIPVVHVTEMHRRDVTLRSLARESERPGWLLRAPNSREGRQHLPGGVTMGTEALQAARLAAAALMPAMKLTTLLDRRARVPSGTTGVAEIGRRTAQVRKHWEEQGAIVPTVMLVVDPLHRLLDPSREEVSGLGEVLSALLDLTHEQGLLSWVTSDTTKRAVDERGKEVKNEDLEQQAELAFRGSYQLMHMPDFAFALRTLRPDVEDHANKITYPEFFEREEKTAWSTVYSELLSPKLRWWETGNRPAFWYDRALFRFVPMKRPRK